MTRNLRILGVAFAATLAMSAFAVVATADEYRSEGNQAVIMTGKQVVTNTLKTTAGITECGTATYSGTVAATPTASVTLTPKYEACKCLGFECTADLNGCDYKLNIAGATTGTAEIVCPAGQEMTFTALGGTKCTIHIKPQTLSTVTYVNRGAPPATREIELVLDLKNIHYTHTEGIGVGKCTGGTGKDGTFGGTVLVTGESDTATPAHIGIFVQ